MKLDDYQFFLRKTVFNFENLGVYYFLNDRTSPQAALDIHAYIEQSARVPTASNKGEGPYSYYVVVGTRVSQQQLLKACATGMASIFTRCGNITVASIALLGEKEECAFLEAEMGLHRACRLPAPFLGQHRVHVAVSVPLFLYHLGWSSFLRNRCGEDLSTLLFALGM